MLTVALALLACGLSSSAQDPDRLFPLPTADMVVDAGDDEDFTSLLDMVTEYGRLTNQEILITKETMGYLRSEGTGLRRSMVIPKAEVQAVFEHVLKASDYVLFVLREEKPRLLSIVSLMSGARNTVRKSALFVPTEDLERWGAHVAVLITTVIHLPHTDVRQLSNAMRTMIPDANTQQMMPAGNTNSVVLTGFASNVVALAHMLRTIDEAAAAEVLEPAFERLPLEHAEAAVAALIVQELIEASNLHAPPPQSQTPRGHVAARVVADIRTNALLVMAMPSDMARIHRLVELVDVEQK